MFNLGVIMGKMEFESQICTTKEQSERLLSLGLKAGTADMLYTTDESVPELCRCYRLEVGCYIPDVDDGLKRIPAWSLSRLMAVLPDSIMGSVIDDCGNNINHMCFFRMKKMTVAYDYYNEEGRTEPYEMFMRADIYDAVIDMFEFLVSEGLMKRDYLQEN